MKRIFTLAMFLLPLLVKAQDSTEFQKSAIVSVRDSASKEELFIRARSWFNKTFVSGKSVLQTADKESGELVGNGVAVFLSNNFFRQKPSAGYLYYTVTITVKDGRYKYVIGRFRHEGETASAGILTKEEEFPYELKWGQSKHFYNALWIELKEKAMDIALPLAKSLKTAMNSKSEKEKEW